MLEFHKYFHWLYYTRNKRHFFNVGTGLFIWLFLVVTQGFGINNNNFTNSFHLILWLLTFGLLWTITIYVVDFIAIRLFKIDVVKSHQTDLILWGVKFVVGIHVNLLYRNYLCDWHCIDWTEYFQAWLAISLMLLLFYIPFAFYGKFTYFQLLVGKDETQNTLFELRGDSKKPLKIDLGRVVFWMADDNYVNVMLLEENRLSKILMRASIKMIEEQLKDQPQFIRIHRKYIINLHYLSGLDKNIAILKYGEEKTSVEIPVSDKYKESLQGLLA